MTEVEEVIRRYIDRFGYIYSYVFKNMTNEKIIEVLSECLKKDIPYEFDMSGIDPDDDL